MSKNPARKRWYICITKCIPSGRCYVGQHVTRLETEDEMHNDGYLGSGILITRAIKKYGKDGFVKWIHGIIESQAAADKMESDFIKTMGVLENRDKWYNRSVGGQYNRSERHSEMMSVIMKEVNNRPEVKEKHLKRINNDEFRIHCGRRTVSQIESDKLRGMRIRLINKLYAIRKMKQKEENERIAKENGFKSYRAYANSKHLESHNAWQKTELGRAAMRESLKDSKRGHEWNNDSRINASRAKLYRAGLDYYHTSCLDQGVMPRAIDSHFGEMYGQGKYKTGTGLVNKCEQIEAKAIEQGTAISSVELVKHYVDHYGWPAKCCTVNEIYK